MKMKGAVEELVKVLEELVEKLVEDRGSHQSDCGQDVSDEKAQLQEETGCQPGA
jgi:hypothetical protein